MKRNRVYTEQQRTDHKKYAREHHRKVKYGITPEAYEAMLLDQQGRCALCVEPMTKPNVDHCHDTGTVRGLLCWACNVGLGKMGDSAMLLRKAADYIDAFNQWSDLQSV